MPEARVLQVLWVRNQGGAGRVGKAATAAHPSAAWPGALGHPSRKCPLVPAAAHPPWLEALPSGAWRHPLGSAVREPQLCPGVVAGEPVWLPPNFLGVFTVALTLARPGLTGVGSLLMGSRCDLDPR